MLQNLNTLKEQLRNNYLLTFWDEDRELPLIFRNQVEIVETYDISFNSNTFVAKSNNGLKIFFLINCGLLQHSFLNITMRLMNMLSI